ncbi:Protein of unknown function (DUF3795) [Candidatus Methanophagaceae archaeon]|nr:Protein of unknown function (DUF3795) [Methanophagales archaeon]
MEENITFCGINCFSCPAYIAKKTDNNDLRIKTAKNWSSIGIEITPEQVNCDGCKSSDGIILMLCNECKVRNCAMTKTIMTCAECPDYYCEKLENLWKKIQTPKAKENLDKIKESLN